MTGRRKRKASRMEAQAVERTAAVFDAEILLDPERGPSRRVKATGLSS